MELVLFTLVLLEFVFVLLYKVIFDAIKERFEIKSETLNITFAFLVSVTTVFIQAVWLQHFNYLTSGLSLFNF